jgi:tetratricopeptide (TPR) repeat protein
MRLLNHLMNPKRIIITLVASLLCCWGIWQAARVGFARTLGEYAARQRRDNAARVVTSLAAVSDAKTAAHKAVAILPGDAENHFALAEVLQRFEDYAPALDEYQRAVALRPRDYYLWMLLGVSRDQNRDQAGALRAFQQAVALAPSYAQPHWQVGNLLLRAGQLDQAFDELRRSALSNPMLWPNVYDLAWGVYGRDAGMVVRVMRPETDAARLALALFFARHDQGAAALEQFRATRVRNDKTSQNVLDELLRARAFSEAYEVWAALRGIPLTNAPLAVIRDRGFEDVLTVGQTGFGWQITPSAANVVMSIDEGAHQSGVRSLRIDFRGDSNPTSSLATQIVLVKPGTRYHLGLTALSKDIVSAADPIITVIDASDPNRAVLATSPPLRSDPNVWRQLAIDFTTKAGTQAITLNLARQTCSNTPCPAFGTIWLDSFSLAAR